LVHLVHELFVVNVTSTYNYNVVSVEVSGVEFSEMVSSKSLENVSISLDWLSHHVVSVDVEVSILNGGLEIPVIVVIMLIGNFFLDKFQLVLIEYTVADCVSK
jgi:hypothetical protein